ncbi:tetratricopeptide repeat-containing sensor histidine kinase [Reichenbachiella ulvae]|uniref:Histidine kinase n=1 Tax=Reichenbachiella ulvae TaxID=2980104 RepID=A0ABT3CVD5_9BACT|nr:histidine kinase [Reichenbachiella ulvae]MCV9387602.1 histidine kinase [Reichenbachiella ulvae]
MLKKIFLIAFLLYLPFSSLFAQSKIDSLRLQLDKVPYDSSFLVLINLSNEYSTIRKGDSAIYYGELALELSEKLGIRRALAHRQLGYAYFLEGINDRAFTITNEGMQWAIKEKDTLNMSWLNVHLASMHLDESRFDSCIYYGMRAMELAMLPKQKTKALRMISLAYMYNGDVDHAILFQQDALKIAEGNEAEMLSISELLAGLYFYKQAYDSSLVMYRKIYDHYVERGLDFRRLRVMANIASVQYGMGNYQLAADSYFDLLEEYRSFDFPKEGHFNLFSNLSINLKMLGRIQEAYQYQDSAERYLQYASLNEEKRHMEHQFELDSISGNYEGMLKDLKGQIVFYDSLGKAQNEQKLEELQTKFETEKKDQEIESLSQQAAIQSLEISKQRNQLVIGALVAVVLVLGGFIFYRQEKARKERSAAELEQRFLRSQLNPHFIFNSMTAIQQYLEENEPEGASHYMGMFSTLMRQILENSRQEFITLSEEVSMLENYLQLQQMRFRDQFDYEIVIDEDLDEDYAGVPPMFAQPFIENSLEHGLFRKDGQKNRIRIHFEKIGDSLVGLEIEDSGVGVEESKVVVDHKSLATKITNERLSKLRAFANKKVGMESQNILNEAGDIHGYRINLRLPTQLVSV